MQHNHVIRFTENKYMMVFGLPKKELQDILMNFAK